MIKFSAFYPNRDDAKFDFDYYVSRHLVLTGELLGDALKGTGIEMGLSGSGGVSAPYRAIGHLMFESIESFRSSFLPHLETLRKDIPNFTNIQPIIQISEVIL